MKEWIEPEKINLSQEFNSSISGHPLILEALAKRGFSDVEKAKAFLDPDYYRPSSPEEFPYMTRAAERIEEAINKKELICVWGDFDVDGQTATTLLVSALKDLGARVIYHIPNRITESHGVNISVMENIINKGTGVILTCDTGITSNDAVAFGRKHGVDFIITDHHELPLNLPQAHAIINPKMFPEEHPLRDLPGVGCAYKLAEELYLRSGTGEKIFSHMDLVALGIVADVAIQKGDTRYLLQKGIKSLRNTERVGLKAIIESAEVNPEELSEEHIGFIIAPRLNSLGRLADANIAVEFLTTRDMTKARILASQMESLNTTRKFMSGQVFESAKEQIKRDPSLLEHEALVLTNSAWPPGIIGIAANKLSEYYNKPAILISTLAGDPARGSARSVPECNITAAIEANKELLLNFGGHPMAAGLSILSEKIPEFRRALSITIQQMKDISKKTCLKLDGYLSFPELSLKFIEEVNKLGPFGNGNPPLVFATKNLYLKSRSKLGQKGIHIKLVVEDEYGNSQSLIWWEGANYKTPEGKFDLAYNLRLSNYRGEKEIQMEFVDFRPVEKEIIEIRTKPIEVIDYRKESEPLEIVKNLPHIQVWSEGQNGIGKNRYELIQSEALIILTIPPGSKELEDVIKKVSPSKVYLFGINPETNQMENFLKTLLGLIKYALSSNPVINIEKLSARTSQRENTVRKGLEWMTHRGYIEIVKENEKEIHIKKGYKNENKTFEIDRRLKALLDETAAYRNYFLNAHKVI